MKRVTTISMLKEDLKDDVDCSRVQAGFYLEFINSSDRWRASDFRVKMFEPNDVDAMVGFLFDLSLTHYIDGYVPYEGARGMSSYVLFFKECGKRRMNTNIDGEVVELLKGLLDSAPRGG